MRALAGAALIGLSACAAQARSDGVDAADNAPLPPVALTPLADGVWLHASYKIIEPWGPIVTNGIVVRRDDGVWLIDTAWTDEQTKEVLALVQAEFGSPVTHAVFTHAHDDKMGGVAALKAAGIATFAHAPSNELAPTRGLEPAAVGLAAAPTGAIDLPAGAPEGITLFYPGPAHTTDNIVAYVPSARVLFGGCMIRPAASASLGNTADGVVKEWAASVRSAAARFDETQIVVPSHGAPGGPGLLDHTTALAEAAGGLLEPVAIPERDDL